MISKIIEYFRPRPLAPSVTAALAAGEAQARRWGQGYVGVEHLLWGLIETLPFDRPDWELLDPLAINWDQVKKTIIETASKPQDRRSRPILPKTPRCKKVLKIADRKSRLRNELQTSASAVLEAILHEAGSVAFHAIVCSVSAIPTIISDEQDWLPNTIDAVRLHGGMAWEIPRDYLQMLRPLFSFEIFDWETVKNDPWSCLINFESISVKVAKYELNDRIRILFSRLEDEIYYNMSTFRSFLEQWARKFASIKDTAEIASLTFKNQAPPDPYSSAGSLNHAFFTQSPPQCHIRSLMEQDHGRVREIYALLEAQNYVPSNYDKVITEWLADPDILRFVLELENKIVSCCSIHTYPNLSGPVAVRWFGWGLVHPSYQRRGFGRAQIAARLALCQLMGIQFICLQATEGKKPFLEKCGFNFWASAQFDIHGPLFDGSMQLTDADTAVLEPWLALLSEECLELARNPPVTPAA